MEITNVGIAMDTIREDDEEIEGRAVVYSKDEDNLELEYADDFKFTYYKLNGDIGFALPEIFRESTREIAEILIDNLKINYLQYK